MRFSLAILFCLVVNFLSAGWINLNTGINDHLTGVVFWGNNGLVSGHKGLYYTTTGGSGTSSWTRFNITTNPADAIIYNNTVFTHAMAESGLNGNGTAFACGKDTVNNKAVIMKLNLPAMTYSMVYSGNTGSSLNFMCSYSSYIADTYYAVGDNGLVINFSSTTGTVVATGMTDNFTSISFANNTSFDVGANGVNIIGTRNTSTGALSFTTINTFGYNYKKVIAITPNLGCAVGNGFYKWTVAGQAPFEIPYYDYGPLNARAIISYSTGLYVGTDHGIFKSSNTFSFLEWQPTSLASKINSFWNAYNSANFYACGDNGTLLYTSDGGGLTKPYAGLDGLGGCKGAVTPITGSTGTSTSCEWYVNGTLFNSACGNPTKVFTTAGQYTIQVNVSNGAGSYDTAVKVINIVDTPKIFRPYQLNKTIICRQEPVNITIDSTQLNVQYDLKKYGTGSVSYGMSGVGTGSTITYNTNTLSIAGNYYLQAQSSIAPYCARKFKDTIKIGVEHTKANFHQAKANVTVAEAFTCFQHCTDAQNYLWTFSPGGNPTNGSLPNPTTTFSNLGNTQIKLVCWSNHGCYDSTTTKGPAVYQEPATLDSCWTMVNNGVDPYWSGIYPPDIAKLAPSKSGFLTCGHFNYNSFASRYGDSIVPPLSFGAYIQKTNRNGVAKWMAYSRQTAGRDQFYTVAEDALGNVYAGGILSGPFYDNQGDSTMLAISGTAGYLIKLDSLGKLVWVIKGISPKSISFDKSNNVIVTSSAGVYQIFLNGTLTYTAPTTSPSANYGVLKLSQAGAVIWHAPVYVNYVNQGGLLNAEADRYNNIYVAGILEGNANLYSANTGTFSTVPGTPGDYGGKLFVARFDSIGVLQWAIRSTVVGTSANNSTAPYSMTADEDGNTYISGRNNCYYGGNTQYFENTDGSTTSLSVGGYYLAKVNNAGICKWIQGTQYAYIGTGHEVNEQGNEISVVGQISNNASTPQTSTFTSANNDSIVLTISRADYFIAVYDTLGNLKHITKNGNNGNLVDTYSFSGMFRENDGSYFISRNFRFYIGASNFDNFGTNVVATNGVDGTITKYSGTCGIRYYPNGTVTQLNNLSDNSSLTLYPNPNDGVFTIQSIKASTYEVYDLLGKLVMEGTLQKGKNQITMPNCPSGLYVLKFKQYNSTFKLVKQ